MILKVKSDWLINTLVHVVIYITGQDFLKVSYTMWSYHYNVFFLEQIEHKH